MSRAVGVIVVHDPACGDCADIADRLSTVLRPPVTARSCRDPELAARHAELRGLGCRAPALGIVRPDGSVRWWIGWTALLGALAVVRPGRLPAAAAVLTRIVRTRATISPGLTVR